MTIGIAGPGRKAPRQNAVVGFIVAAVVVVICLILLRLAGDFLVDWLWFSSIGYLQVFLTSIGAKVAVFFAVLIPTTVILWLNGLLRNRLPWPRVIASGAGLLAVLVAMSEVGNWSLFLRFFYHVPYGANDPL